MEYLLRPQMSHFGCFEDIAKNIYDGHSEDFILIILKGKIAWMHFINLFLPILINT